MIATWPSFALIASYELLMRQVRHAAEVGTSRQRPGGFKAGPGTASSAGRLDVRRPDGRGRQGAAGKRRCVRGRGALVNSCADGSLPSGMDIVRQRGGYERWGRLVRRSGLACELDS